MASIITPKRDDNRSAGARAMAPGLLCDYETGETIREATEQETRESIAQAARDGGAGVLQVGGRSCYVQGGHDGSELTIEVAS